jgi:hypothetical protein
VAWAEHTNLGDYTTAVLMWLEGGGKGERLLAPSAEPASLLPAFHTATHRLGGSTCSCQAPSSAPPYSLLLTAASTSSALLLTGFHGMQLCMCMPIHHVQATLHSLQRPTG